MEFTERFQAWTDLVNHTLTDTIEIKAGQESLIYEAMRYSLFAGGKRIRPVLALAVCDLLDGNIQEVLPYACVLEMIHTYSLIHDDLPAMDNDDFRRGKFTSHKVFGEAIAILAGDALLNASYEIMINDALKSRKNSRNKLKAMSVIAEAAGASGMIGGQVIDLLSEGSDVSIEELSHMHHCKTGALIRASVLSAAEICGATKVQIESLCSFAQNLGLAFQIKDDILDVEGNSEKMGKESGSDQKNEKSTFVKLLGLEKSKFLLKEMTKKAINSLSPFGESATFLIGFAEYLVAREN